MSGNWKGDHLDQLGEKHAHIRQKLAQLEMIRAVLRELKDRLREQYELLHEMQFDENGAVRNPLDLLDPELYARMVGVGGFLSGAWGTMSDPAPSGGGEQPAGPPGAYSITDAMGPIGTSVGLGDFVDEFGMTGGLDDAGFWGSLGWGAGQMWQWFTSPFAQYQRTKFTWRAQDLMEEIRRNHGADLDELAASYRDALTALTSLEQALAGADLSEGSVLGGQGAADLEAILDGYDDAYDSAPGSGPPSDLFDLGAEGFAAGPDVSEASERMQAALEQRAAELDSIGDDYEPAADPDLEGLDDLPAP